MENRLVAIVLMAVICLPVGVEAAPCTLPTNPVIVQYDVYSELESFPGGGTAQSLITTHMQRAQDAFLPHLKIMLTDGSRPDVRKLSEQQADLVRTLLEGVGGDDLEEVIAEFKNAAEQDGFYNPEILNIYYVGGTPITGMHFRKRQGLSHNIIVIGQGFLDETLAHELGHAFSLDHANFWSHDDPNLCEKMEAPCEHGNTSNKKIFPNGVQVEYCAEYGYHDNVCEFTRKNLMWAKSVTRTKVTKNQAKRAACNTTSTLVSNGDRANPGDTTNCPDWSREGVCEEVYQ